MPETNASPKVAAIVGYALVVFVLGLSTGMLVPLVSDLIRLFHVSLASIVFFIALLGLSSLFLSYPSAYLTAKGGAATTLKVAVGCEVIGLLLRALGQSYAVFLVGQIIVTFVLALGYGPLGAILRSAGVTRLRAATSIIIGCMPLGLGIASLGEAVVFKALGMRGTFWLALAIAVAAGIYVWITSDQIPRPDRGQPAPRLRIEFNRWWLVAFATFGIGNLLQPIIAPALLHLHVKGAFLVAGEVGAVVAFGSALVSIGLGFAGDAVKQPLALVRWVSLGVIVVVGIVAATLAGLAPLNLPLLFVGTFLWGGLCYTVNSLLQAEVAHGASSQTQAGVHTASITMAGSFGGAVVQQTVGPLVVVHGELWALIVLALVVFSAVVSFWPARVRQPALRTTPA